MDWLLKPNLPLKKEAGPVLTEQIDWCCCNGCHFCDAVIVCCDSLFLLVLSFGRHISNEASPMRQRIEGQYPAGNLSSRPNCVQKSPNSETTVWVSLDPFPINFSPAGTAKNPMSLFLSLCTSWYVINSSKIRIEGMPPVWWKLESTGTSDSSPPPYLWKSLISRTEG